MANATAVKPVAGQKVHFTHSTSGEFNEAAAVKGGY